MPGPLTPQAIRKVGHRYRQGGLERALYEKQRPGAAEVLDDSQKQRIMLLFGLCSCWGYRLPPPSPHPAVLLSLPTSLLPIALTGQRGFHAALLSRLQVKGVSFDLLDDVLLQNLPLETAERILQRLAFLELYLSQLPPPTLTMISVHCSNLQPNPILLMASYGLFRLWSRLGLSQLFRQLLAGLEVRIPFCRDCDGLSGARVAALTLLPIFHHETAEPT
jgi:hypothetical protein